MSNSIHWLNFIQTISDIGSYLAEKISFLSLMTARKKVV